MGAKQTFNKHDLNRNKSNTFIPIDYILEKHERLFLSITSSPSAQIGLSSSLEGLSSLLLYTVSPGAWTRRLKAKSES